MKNFNIKFTSKSILSLLVLVLALVVSGCGVGNQVYVILDPDMVNALKEDGAKNIKCDKEFALKPGNSGKCSYEANGYAYVRTIAVAPDKKLYVSKVDISASDAKVNLTFAANGSPTACSPTGDYCKEAMKAFKTGMGDLNKQINDSFSKANTSD